VLVGVVAFAGGGYLGLIESVGKLDEPRTYETHLLDAVVAKEDERFREHGGVDLWGILRALWIDIRAGEAVEGASTITQQHVRNAYLSQNRSITRKIKEALIAIPTPQRTPNPA
jgi:membrane peptidoglycan carboxypeptidase